MNKSLTVYMFGYSGWGPATDKLWEAVTAVESDNNRKPPLFVDIRMRRDVRATGFHESHFEDLIGPDNYLWMPLLGNLAVRKDLKPHLEHLEDPIFICHEPAAEQLLKHAYECRRQQRRLIFFCSCATPVGCHRVRVAKLLIREAQKLGRRLNVVEWPGGKPCELKEPIRVTNRSMPTASSPNLYLRRFSDELLARYASLPTGSIVTVSINGETRRFPVASLRYSRPKRRWYFETLRNEGYVSVRAADGAVQKYRDEYGYAPVTLRT